jgi:peroxiredoxin Q/BCP
VQLIVAWPKDLTPCCAPQKSALAAKIRHLASFGVEVVALSPTAFPEHEAYVQRYDLRYPLLLDPDFVRLRSYGWVEERTVRGKSYRHVSRAAALVDREGKVLRTFAPFDLEHDLLQVLAAV